MSTVITATTTACARLALDDGLVDAERIIAMLRVRGYAVRRMLICDSTVELAVECDGDRSAALLEPRLRRLRGPRLLGPVEFRP